MHFLNQNAELGQTEGAHRNIGLHLKRMDVKCIICSGGSKNSTLPTTHTHRVIKNFDKKGKDLKNIVLFSSQWAPVISKTGKKSLQIVSFAAPV